MLTESRSPSPARLTPEDRWFVALDNYTIRVGTERRRLHIFGVHRAGREVWIQLAPLDDSTCDIAIRCWHHQPPAEVLATLCLHLAASRSPSRTIDARSGTTNDAQM